MGIDCALLMPNIGNVGSNNNNINRIQLQFCCNSVLFTVHVGYGIYVDDVCLWKWFPNDYGIFGVAEHDPLKFWGIINGIRNEHKQRHTFCLCSEYVWMLISIRKIHIRTCSRLIIIVIDNNFSCGTIISHHRHCSAQDGRTHRESLIIAYRQLYGRRQRDH